MNKISLVAGKVWGPEEVERLTQVAVQWTATHVRTMREGWFVWPKFCRWRRYCDYWSLCRWAPRRGRRRRQAEGWGGSGNE